MMRMMRMIGMMGMMYDLIYDDDVLDGMQAIDLLNTGSNGTKFPTQQWIAMKRL